MHKMYYIVFIALLLFTGCANNTTETLQGENNYINQKTSNVSHELTTSNNYTQAPNIISKKMMTADEMCESVLYNLQVEDLEQLKNLFCNEIVSTHNLDDELLNFFDFVDGKFIAFTDYHTELRHGGESNKGAYVKFFIAPRIRVAKTDTEKKYTVEFYANLIYKDEPNRIGLEYIVITDSEGNELWVGDYIDN